MKESDEFRQPDLVCSFGRRWVVKSPVHPLPNAGERRRAAFFGIRAHRDEITKVQLTHVLAHILG